MATRCLYTKQIKTSRQTQQERQTEQSVDDTSTLTASRQTQRERPYPEMNRQAQHATEGGQRRF